MGPVLRNREMRKKRRILVGKVQALPGGHGGPITPQQTPQQTPLPTPLPSPSVGGGVSVSLAGPSGESCGPFRNPVLGPAQKVNPFLLSHGDPRLKILCLKGERLIDLTDMREQQVSKTNGSIALEYYRILTEETGQYQKFCSGIKRRDLWSRIWEKFGLLSRMRRHLELEEFWGLEWGELHSGL